MAKCAVWGIRSAGQFMAEEAVCVGYEIVAYCSGLADEQGLQIQNIPVISPEELRASYLEKKIDCVIVGIKNPNHLQEIKNLLDRNFPVDMPVIYPDVLEDQYLKKIRPNLQWRWSVDFKTQASIWVQNFMSEVAYWANEVANPNAVGYIHDDYLNRLENKYFLGIDASCHELAARLHEGSIVMDIGCGLVSKYGAELPNSERLQLLAVDPLAAFYSKINDKYSKAMGTPCKFGLFEFIANYYDRNFCDAILINNALDHCIDPYKSIIECLYILKPQGTMRLNHYRAEAVFETYSGLHKWNIDYNEQNEFIIWNQENAINISRQLQKIADIRVSHINDNVRRLEQCVIVEIVKTKDFGLEEFFDMEKERKDLAFFSECLLDWISSQKE